MYALPTDVFIPAPAQGVIALECPDRDFPVREALAQISSPDTVLAAAMERLALWMLGGDCHTAIGAAWGEGTLRVFCATSDGEMQELAFELEEKHARELAELLERERGFYHGFFESLKSTALARSLYVSLRTAEFRTLIPWNG
jgi:porphobilinogen deaminase